MSGQLLVAGGGIGGLAAALAAARAGWHARVYEQSLQISEVGAGLQLGPNATRVLRAWGLLEALQSVACAPRRLVARDVGSGRVLGELPLGAAAEARYGAPYLTVHRADLQSILLDAARAAGVAVSLGARASGLRDTGEAVQLALGPGEEAPEGDALVAADGLWSALRAQLLADGPARPSDHVAYRGLVPAAGLPSDLRRPEVTAWLAPGAHVVSYPVRGGADFNIVCVVQQPTESERTGWDHPAAAARLRAALGPGLCAPLRQWVEAVPAWGLWVLHDRPPVEGAEALARGRVALLGDAAHPMRPYLAQGAAMALEDAFELGRVLRSSGECAVDVPTALRRYALNRWPRVARVQRRSLRNAAIFHATGAMRVGRDAAMRLMGARVMDVPWLYGA